jgi:hypothetical protein
VPSSDGVSEHRLARCQQAVICDAASRHAMMFPQPHTPRPPRTRRRNLHRGSKVAESRQLVISPRSSDRQDAGQVGITRKCRWPEGCASGVLPHRFVAVACTPQARGGMSSCSRRILTRAGQTGLWADATQERPTAALAAGSGCVMGPRAGHSKQAWFWRAAAVLLRRRGCSPAAVTNRPPALHRAAIASFMAALAAPPRAA